MSEIDKWFIYLQAGNDKAALHILVNQLEDYKSAEQYCIVQSLVKSTVAERQDLFETLLHLYLDKTK